MVKGLAAEFVKNGNEVDIITMGYRDLPQHEKVDGATIRRVPCLRKSIDICQPHEQASYLMRAMPAATEAGRKKSYDIIHCHFIVPDGLAGLRASSKLGIPVAVTAHGSDVPGYNPDRFKFLHKVIRPAWRRTARAIDRIICPSNYLQELILKHEPAAKTMAIPNGLDLDKFDSNKQRRRRILVVTRMLERKGVQDVIRALAGSDLGVEFHIVGTGPYLNSLIEQAKDMNVDARFHGWLDNDSNELKELFETSSIFVFPSHAENFPLVLLEAMAAGLAIITTNQTGCCEVVGDTAIQVTPGDDRAIRAALEQLASDPEECERMGRRARKRLDDHFSWPAVAQQYLDAFQNIIDGNPAMGPRIEQDPL